MPSLKSDYDIKKLMMMQKLHQGAPTPTKLGMWHGNYATSSIIVKICFVFLFTMFWASNTTKKHYSTLIEKNVTHFNSLCNYKSWFLRLQQDYVIAAEASKLISQLYNAMKKFKPRYHIMEVVEKSTNYHLLLPVLKRTKYRGIIM